MFWVLQKNLYNEQAFESLCQQLDRQGSKYQIVDLIPFAHEMIPDINVEGPVFVLGSTAMRHVSKKKGWKPGYIDANIDYEKLIENYSTFMLNIDAIIVSLQEAYQFIHNLSYDEFFIRPVNDGKSFAGYVTNKALFIEWYEKLVQVNDGNSYTTVQPSDLVVIAPLRNIVAEYRFFVVNGKVITGSQYKIGNRVVLSDKVDARVYEFAQNMANIWSPNEAYALDIADTAEDQLRVLEINSINSAGFYACDMGKFIHAIETL